LHFYWRVIEELKFLGETWIINDPSLLRSYNRWLYKNAEAIAFTEMGVSVICSALFEYKGLPHSLS